MGIDRQIEAVLGYRNISLSLRCRSSISGKMGKEQARGEIWSEIESKLALCILSGFILERVAPPRSSHVSFVFFFWNIDSVPRKRSIVVPTLSRRYIFGRNAVSSCMCPPRCSIVKIFKSRRPWANNIDASSPPFLQEAVGLNAPFASLVVLWSQSPILPSFLPSFVGLPFHSVLLPIKQAGLRYAKWPLCV